MKSIIKDILIAQMSFPLKYKNEKEIWWKNKYGHPATIEIIDTGNEQYIERGYWGDGRLRYEENYKQGQLHGKCFSRYNNGQLWHKINYHQGKWHGEYLERYNNGQLRYKKNYYQGRLHGEYLEWYDNGQLCYKREYNYGKLINEEYY